MIVVPQPAGMKRKIAQDCLIAEGLEFEAVNLTENTDYGKLMRRLWEEGETFVVVEHDICPWPGAIQSLLDCPRLLCGYDYMRQGNIGHSLGLTKFDEHLIELAPDAWKGWGDNAPLLQWDLVDWTNVDAAVYDSLAGYGVYLNESVDAHLHKHMFHVHEPPVGHSRMEP